MVASDWVDRYQADAEAAMVELIQFFVFCCGCKATITMQMFQMEDSSDVIRVLTENFAEVYALIWTSLLRLVCVSLLGQWRVPIGCSRTCLQEV